MQRMTPRLNYYFQPCKAVTKAGALAQLDGFGVVTIHENGEQEEVYLPDQMSRHILVEGEISRLEQKGLAECYGQTWKD